METRVVAECQNAGHSLPLSTTKMKRIEGVGGVRSF
jgi:hypothetical protein